MVLKFYRNNDKKVNTTKNNKTFINMNRKNDECYTRQIEADKLVNYLFNHKIINIEQKIWLPFNDYKGSIYKALKKKGFKHLLTNRKDFYEKIEEKFNFDIIISNPPFSGRSKLFLKLMELDKPFILLQPIMFFNNGTCIKILTKYGAKFGGICPSYRMTFDRNFGFLCPNKNMGFVINNVERKSTSAFYSFWLCFKTKITGFTPMENENI